MIKKRIVQGFVTGILVATVMCGGGHVNIAEAETIEPLALSSVTNEESSYSTREAVLIWAIKEEDGKTYRRLYDATNEVWLTDWILCE